MNDICDFEIRVLRVCASEPDPDLSWGAAVGQALEYLRGRGLVEVSAGAYQATAAGRALLQELAK